MLGILPNHFVLSTWGATKLQQCCTDRSGNISKEHNLYFTPLQFLKHVSIFSKRGVDFWFMPALEVTEKGQTFSWLFNADARLENMLSARYTLLCPTVFDDDIGINSGNDNDALWSLNAWLQGTYSVLSLPFGPEEDNSSTVVRKFAQSPGEPCSNKSAGELDLA